MLVSNPGLSSSAGTVLVTAPLHRVNVSFAIKILKLCYWFGVFLLWYFNYVLHQALTFGNILFFHALKKETTLSYFSEVSETYTQWKAQVK